MSELNAFSAAAQQGGAVATSPASGSSASKDRKDAETNPQFGDILKKIQSQYGAKAEKPREIKKTLGKDDFLRIMITQMKHQDPTSPFKAEQMAAEMAQFTSVEQLQNMNQSLKKLTDQGPAERMAMTSLIGKVVTVDRDRFPHNEGDNESLSFTLPRAAKQTHIALISETGEVVLEKDIGPQKRGDNVFAWDGLKSNNLPAKNGNYMLRVEAKDENGNDIQSDPRTKARVVGVSFEGKDPVLLVGDGKTQAKITMQNVVRIESESPAPVAGAPAGATADAGAASPNFIAYKKGEGSSNLDPSTAPPEIAAALAKFGQPQDARAPAEFRPVAKADAAGNAARAAAIAAAKAAAAADSGEKGFPNGLHD